ncbi:MAG TPA: glycoside hydrolase family 127 protein [Candidatus Alistipes intestinipullorum]|nr:glycoside hydrolase family 127 protein [Candidatus Alistipes intestinipullorum]
MKNLLSAIIFSLVFYSCQRPESPSCVPYFGQFREASVAQIHPEGWFRELLEIQRDGLGSHRVASGYPYNTCLWEGVIPKGGNPIAQDWWPYEQSGYMVDGLYRCGILLGDSSLMGLGRRNVAYVLAHPRENGMLGPEALGELQWAFSVFARAMLADYDLTGDTGVLEGLRRHFDNLPDSLTNRQACILESMCRVYAQTGDRSLLDHAERIWRTFSMPGTSDNEAFRHDDMVAARPVEVHGVTAAEVSKLPAILYLYTGNREYLDAALGFYASVERDHELVDGIPASYEKLLGKRPEALHETCDVSDFLWSYGYLLMATGDVRWADKMENAFYNAALGSISKDFRSHQYFSSPNQIVATQYSSMADYGEEGLSRQAYRPGFDTECCSGNVHRMFPNFASRMWMRSGDDGIVAALYAPGRFETRVSGRDLRVVERTEYPFRDEIAFEFVCDGSVRCPFTFRVPSWTENAEYCINDGEPVPVSAGKYHTIERTFRSGDRIVVRLPMRPRVEVTAENGVSVRRGPLLFSVDIAEDARPVTDQMKTSDEFPAWDIVPASAWNYALEKGVEIETVERPVGSQPWLPENAPVRLRLPAYRVPSWRMEGPSTPELPAPGFLTESHASLIEMIPSGMTRIRLTTLPLK